MMIYQDYPISRKALDAIPLAYDYTNQAWVRYGQYLDCSHAETCNCYGRAHKGEPVKDNADLA